MSATLSLRQPFLFIFAVMILTSSVVYMEPAPYDLLFVLLLLIAAYSRHIIYTGVQFWPILLLFLFLMTNIFSLFFIQKAAVAGSYLVITIYGIVVWFGLVGMMSYLGKGILPLIFKMYIVAALLVAVPGIIGYFTQIEVLDQFVWTQDRVRGLFKDPNVFGPFLVPPALYSLWRIGRVRQSQIKTIIYITTFLIMMVGILLSYSRAAWGQFVLAVLIYLILINDRMTNRFKTLFIIGIIFFPAIYYIITQTDAGDLFFDRTGLQGYDDDRFAEQSTSLQYVNLYPFGFGPGQSEVILNQSTHSLFIRLLSENGLLGLVFFCLFFLATITRGLYMALKTDAQFKGYFIIVTVSLIGIAFNSFFVDTMHWRHFWLLLALPWISIRTYVDDKYKGVSQRELGE